MSPPLTSALLAQQAIAAAASAPASRSSSRPRTLSGGKDLLREDVCDLSDSSEDDDTDCTSDEENELIDERFLDPNSDEGIATRVAAYARELSTPAKRSLRSFPVEVLRNATAYFERLEGDDLVLEARKGHETLCLRRTNFQELCLVEETRPLLQTSPDADPAASLIDVLQQADARITASGFDISPIPRRRPHPPSPIDNPNPYAHSRVPNSVQLRLQASETYRQSRLRLPPPPVTASASDMPNAQRSGFDYEAFRANTARRNGGLLSDAFFPVATERRGTTALGRMLADETSQTGATSNAPDAVTTVERDGQTSTVRVTAPRRGVELEMVLYEEEEVEEEQEGADDPAAEEGEREREETERREGSTRLVGPDEVGR